MTDLSGRSERESAPSNWSTSRAVAHGASRTFTAASAMGVYQWLILVVAAHWTTAEEVGSMALGFAIATPILAFSTAGLRLVQISDVAFDFSMKDYMTVRAGGVSLSVIFAFVWVALDHASTQDRLVIYLVILVRGLEALADFFWSRALQERDFSRYSRSLIVRSVAGSVAIVIAVKLSRNLADGLATIVVVSLLVLTAYDSRGVLSKLRLEEGRRRLPTRNGARGKALIRRACPLSVASALTALNASIPRLFLVQQRGQEAVAVFSAMASIFPAASLFTAALGQAAIPTLSALVSSHRTGAFRHLLGSLLLAGLALGTAFLAAGWFFGHAFLDAAFGQSYASDMVAFRWLLVGLVVMLVTTFLQDGLTALNWGRSQAAIFGAGTLTTALWCKFLVPAFGIDGAAAAFAFGALAQFAIFVWVVRVAIGTIDAGVHPT